MTETLLNPAHLKFTRVARCPCGRGLAFDAWRARDARDPLLPLEKRKELAAGWALTWMCAGVLLGEVTLTGPHPEVPPGGGAATGSDGKRHVSYPFAAYQLAPESGIKTTRPGDLPRPEAPPPVATEVALAAVPSVVRELVVQGPAVVVYLEGETETLCPVLPGERVRVVRGEQPGSAVALTKEAAGGA